MVTDELVPAARRSGPCGTPWRFGEQWGCVPPWGWGLLSACLAKMSLKSSVEKRRAGGEGSAPELGVFHGGFIKRIPSGRPARGGSRQRGVGSSSAEQSRAGGCVPPAAALRSRAEPDGRRGSGARRSPSTSRATQVPQGIILQTKQQTPTSQASPALSQFSSQSSSVLVSSQGQPVTVTATPSPAHGHGGPPSSAGVCREGSGALMLGAGRAAGICTPFSLKAAFSELLSSHRGGVVQPRRRGALGGRTAPPDRVRVFRT